MANTIRPGDELLTVTEVAELLRISKHWVYKYVHHPEAEQRLPALQIGGMIRIWRSALEAYIKKAEETVPLHLKESELKREAARVAKAKAKAERTKKKLEKIRASQTPSKTPTVREYLKSHENSIDTQKRHR
jgi:excisionase family DNA binding protein